MSFYPPADHAVETKLPAGLVLAGGKSLRMGGVPKAQQLLAGGPMLGYVLDRLQPQVSETCLSVPEASEAWSAFGVPLVTDYVPGHNGPLQGLAAGLQRLAPRHEWLLLVPCDAPFLPSDLASRLLAAARDDGVSCSVARYQGEVQPTFSLWHRNLLPEMRATAATGQGGLKFFTARLAYTVVDWDEKASGGLDGQRSGAEPGPFFNVNTPEDIAIAERWLESSNAPAKNQQEGK